MSKGVTACRDTSPFIDVKVYAQNPTSRPRTQVIQYAEKNHLLIILQIHTSYSSHPGFSHLTHGKVEVG